MKIKPFVTITLFIFWAAVTALLTAGLVFYRADKGGIQPPAVQAPEPAAPAGTSSAGNVVLSAQEIAKHGSAEDCWMIFSGKVYDVTSAIYAHPAGPDTIIAYCGKDGTVAFKTKNKPEPKDHSANAYSWLDSLLIGSVGQAVTPATLQGIKQTAPVAPGQYGEESDNEYEDEDD